MIVHLNGKEVDLDDQIKKEYIFQKCWKNWDCDNCNNGCESLKEHKNHKLVAINNRLYCKTCNVGSFGTLLPGDYIIDESFTREKKFEEHKKRLLDTL